MKIIMELIIKKHVMALLVLAMLAAPVVTNARPLLGDPPESVDDSEPGQDDPPAGIGKAAPFQNDPPAAMDNAGPKPDNTPPGGDGDPGGAPIDGGLSLLLAAGVGYGVKKYRDTRKGRVDLLKS